MSQILKLLLICFLTATVFSARYRIRQPVVPGMEGNITEQAAFPGMEGNVTNATEVPPAFPGMEGNITEQAAFPGMEGNVTNATEVPPAFPGMEGNITEQPAFPGFPDIEGIIEETFGGAGNRTLRTQRPKQAPPSSTGQQGIPAESPSETGAAFASSTIINVNQPVISVNGQAMGTIQPDLIKIGVVVQNQGGKVGEALTQNEQTVNGLIEKIKELGIREQNILNLGQMFRVSAKITLTSVRSVNQTEGESAPEPSGNGLVSYSQLEVQVNDIATAGKVVDFVQSQGNQIKYIDFSYQPETLAYAVNNLITLALNDAENRAKGGLSGTGYQVGKLLNLNVNVNPDFKNYLNDGQQGPDGNVPAAPKIIKVVVSATYAMEPKSGEQPVPQPTPQPIPEPSPQPTQPQEGVPETPVTTAPSQNTTMTNETEVPQVTSVRRKPNRTI